MELQQKEDKPILLDNSKRACFELCERKYYYSYVRNLEPDKGSTSLRYGTCWHELMDVYYTELRDKPYSQETIKAAMTEAINAMKQKWDDESAGRIWFSDYKTLDNLLVSFAMYVRHFNQDHTFMKVTHTERKFNISMFDLDGKEFYFAGKIDGEASLSGIHWNLEHKTTSQPIFKQEQRLNRSAQFMGYTYAGLRFGRDIEGTLVMFHHISATKSRKTGEYGKTTINFKRVAQMFTQADLASWEFSLRNTATKLHDCYENDRWPMQHDSCYQYGVCQYTDLCDQNVPLGEEKTEGFFERVPWDKEITAEVING